MGKFFRLMGFLLLCWPASSETVEVMASDTNQLRALLENQNVEAMLTDSTYLRGRVRDVRQSSIVLQVRGSRGPGQPGKGRSEVATDRFSTFQITRVKGSKRFSLLAAFAGAGFVAGFFGGLESDFETATGKTAVIALPIAGGVGGYLLGRKLDRQPLTVVIKKANQPARPN